MMDLTQELLDRADLVVVVDRDGLFEWSAHRSSAEVANVLHTIADAIAAEAVAS